MAEDSHLYPGSLPPTPSVIRSTVGASPLILGPVSVINSTLVFLNMSGDAMEVKNLSEISLKQRVPKSGSSQSDVHYCSRNSWRRDGSSGVLPGIHCESAQELQKCMAPLTTLSCDDMGEASLLKTTGEEHVNTPTPEEKAALLGEEIKPPTVHQVSPEQPEFPRFVEPAGWGTTPGASCPSPAPQPSYLPSGKAKKSQQGMKADPDR